MRYVRWIWDWHVEITIGLYGGVPVLWCNWTQRSPPPWSSAFRQGQ